MGRDFKKLEIWTLSYNLVLDIYPLLESYPESENRNLVDQIRRLITSLPVDIAEGAGSESSKIFLTYLNHASKSAKKLDLLLLLSQDMGFIENDIYTFLQKKLEAFKEKLSSFLIQVEKEVHRPNFNYDRSDLHRPEGFPDQVHEQARMPDVSG